MLNLRLDETIVRFRKVGALIAHPFYLKRFLTHSVAPAIEHVPVLRILPVDYIVDAGANRGQFSLVCRYLKPEARITAFEPLAEPAAVYRALFAGDSQVQLHECALGTERGDAEMHISARDDSSSLLPIGKAQTDHYPGSGEIGTQPVTIRPMTDLISGDEMGARNLLKLDVQGYELEVLKSAEALLPRFTWIYVECSYVPLYEGQALADEVCNFLCGRGFKLRGRYNVSYTHGGNEPLQADFLFQKI
jgi:FkbM family methyltransferase